MFRALPSLKSARFFFIHHRDSARWKNIQMLLLGVLVCAGKVKCVCRTASEQHEQKNEIKVLLRLKGAHSWMTSRFINSRWRVCGRLTWIRWGLKLFSMMLGGRRNHVTRPPPSWALFISLFSAEVLWPEKRMRAKQAQHLLMDRC